MGVQASKQIAKDTIKRTTRESTAARNAAQHVAHQKQKPVVQTVLSVQEVQALTAQHNPASMEQLIRPAQSDKNDAIGLIEMNHEVLEGVKRFDDYEKVAFLSQSMDGFQGTASSYRPHSSSPIPKPQDRTAAAASGTLIEHMAGRLTNNQMRELLRLHYENATEWTEATLAAKFAIEQDIVRAILLHVGPPKVLEPTSLHEHPFGVWHDEENPLLIEKHS